MVSVCDNFISRHLHWRPERGSEYSGCDAMHIMYPGPPLQAHMELDIKAKIQLLTGIVERPWDVPAMIRKQPQILALSEVTIQV